MKNNKAFGIFNRLSPSRLSTGREKAASIKRRTVKVLLMGNAGVGKTSIIHNLCNEEFKSMYRPTVFDIYEKEALIDDFYVKFELLDISGSYSFPAMKKLYIQQADIFLLVFSEQDKNSFDEIDKLRKEIEQIKSRHTTELSITVIKNKMDLCKSTSKKRRRTDSVLNWCYSYLETSARTGFNMHAVDEYLLSESVYIHRAIEEKTKQNDLVSGRYVYYDNNLKRRVGRHLEKHVKKLPIMRKLSFIKQD
ncbi:ras-like protein 2 [Hydractinia symbiolongicarpus]|uniref:ras-like protein 2 n=1 Tax=Hydractinia symbiolongicarpus TaxID=13093 RepID=UPI00254AB21F|nr:ras-like protein 2 [Hydractinia symbiolongicarpus]